MLLPDIPFLPDEPLAKHTSYRIGGPARYLVQPESLAHLRSLGNHLQRSHEAFAIIGNGSNLLVPDEGFDGWVIKTNLLPQFLVPLSNHKIHVSAGTNNSRTLRATAELGLSGFEYLAGVPGTIGGALWMNAGTASGWVADNVLRIESFSLLQGRKSYDLSQIKYSYRQQHFLAKDEIILSASFQLKQADPELIKKALAESLKKRKEAQPIEMPSCGSVFRNPTGSSAWSCVDKVGLRGHQIGGARFSPKHSNFIVNEGGATMKDVRALIDLAKAKVKAELGIDLEEEVVELRPNKI